LAAWKRRSAFAPYLPLQRELRTGGRLIFPANNARATAQNVVFSCSSSSPQCYCAELTSKTQNPSTLLDETLCSAAAIFIHETFINLGVGGLGIW
jgi:hypothetical protein